MPRSCSRSLPVGVRGFTLLETVIALTVVALVAAVVGPKWLENDTDVQVVAQQLQNDIRYVQGLAMTHGQRHRIYFNVSTGYRIADNSGTNVAHPLNSSGNVSFPSGVTIQSNGFSSGYLAFDGRGIPYDGATSISAATTVRLVKNGTTRTLTLTPDTGYVTVTSP